MLVLALYLRIENKLFHRMCSAVEPSVHRIVPHVQYTQYLGTYMSLSHIMSAGLPIEPWSALALIDGINWDPPPIKRPVSFLHSALRYAREAAVQAQKRSDRLVARFRIRHFLPAPLLGGPIKLP